MKVQKLSTIERLLQLAYQVNTILVDRWKARKGCITYGQINEKVPDMKHKDIGPVLRMLTAHYKAEGLPLLTALVVSPKTWRPNNGFFDSARDLGYQIPNTAQAEEAFWLWQIFWRMKLYEETWGAQQPQNTPWRDQVQGFRQLGCIVDFHPLVDNVPNATSLAGKRLVNMVVKKPRLSPPDKLSPTISAPSEILFSTEDVVASDRTEVFRALRSVLQDVAQEQLHARLESLFGSLLPTGDAPGTTSGLPTGDGPETASQLPGDYDVVSGGPPEPVFCHTCGGHIERRLVGGGSPYCAKCAPPYQAKV